MVRTEHTEYTERSLLWLACGLLLLRAAAGAHYEERPLIISKDNELLLMDEHQNFHSLLRMRPYSIDYLWDAKNGHRIFWSELQNRNIIYSGVLLENKLINISSLVFANSSSIEGIAVDWIAKNLYWVVANTGKINVATLNGRHSLSLIEGLLSPRALAIDPVAGLLFWSDWNNHLPCIERSDLAGQQRQRIFETSGKHGGWINAITLDFSSRKIYWVDAKSDYIYFAMYDGSHSQKMYEHKYLKHPMGIAINGELLVWSDQETNKVVQINIKNETKQVKILYETYSNLHGIKFLQPQPGTSRNNSCRTNSPQCSQLCLMKSSIATCHCASNMYLAADNKTCLDTINQEDHRNDTSKTEISTVPVDGFSTVYKEDLKMPTTDSFPMLSEYKECNLHCLNGGLCSIHNISGNVSCRCLLGFVGDVCEYECECSQGECIIKDDQASCDCHEGYTGSSCDQIMCSNCANGNCSMLNQKPTCSCFEGWYGVNCTEQVIVLESVNCYDWCNSGIQNFTEQPMESCKCAGDTLKSLHMSAIQLCILILMLSLITIIIVTCIRAYIKKMVMAEALSVSLTTKHETINSQHKDPLITCYKKLPAMKTSYFKIKKFFTIFKVRHSNTSRDDCQARLELINNDKLNEFLA